MSNSPFKGIGLIAVVLTVSAVAFSIFTGSASGNVLEIFNLGGTAIKAGASLLVVFGLLYIFSAIT